jgi:hypothetical protein
VRAGLGAAEDPIAEHRSSGYAARKAEERVGGGRATAGLGVN